MKPTKSYLTLLKLTLTPVIMFFRTSRYQLLTTSF